MKIQYFTEADNLDGYAAVYFLPSGMLFVLRVYHYPITRAMKTYGSIFQAETEGTICPVKESYYTGGAEERAAAARFTGCARIIRGGQRFAEINGNC